VSIISNFLLNSSMSVFAMALVNTVRSGCLCVHLTDSVGSFVFVDKVIANLLKSAGNVIAVASASVKKEVNIF